MSELWSGYKQQLSLLQHPHQQLYQQLPSKQSHHQHQQQQAEHQPLQRTPSPSTGGYHLTQFDAYRNATFTVKPYVVQSQDDGQLHQHTADDVLRALLLSAGGRTVGGGEGDGDAKIGAKPFWSINYQDFVADVRGLDSSRPYCTETFSHLVNRANAWLRQNPDVQVTSCETITSRSPSLITIGDSEAVVYECPRDLMYSDVITHVTLGVRLWVKPRIYDSNQSPHQQQHHHEQQLPPTQRIVHRDFRPITGDRWNTFIRRINAALVEEPLPGHVLAIDLATLPPSGSLYWPESPGSRGQGHVVILRIFCVEDTPRLQTIGVKTIIAEGDGANRESFSQLVQRASDWLANGLPEGATLANLKCQYVPLPCAKKPLQEAAEKHIEPVIDLGQQAVSQVLHVFFVHGHSVTPDAAGAARVRQIHCVTFTPVQTTLEPSATASFEAFKQIAIRIDAWLRLSGAQVRNLETVTTPMLANTPNHNYPEVTYCNPQLLLLRQHYHRYLVHVRLYVDGDFEDPEPSLLPPLPYSLALAMQQNFEKQEEEARAKKRLRKRRAFIVVPLVLALLIGIVFLVDYVLHLLGIKGRY